MFHFRDFRMEEDSGDIDNPDTMEGADNDSNKSSEDIVTFEPHKVLNSFKGQMKSEIWKFFVFKGTLSEGASRDSIYCSLCPKKLSYTGGTINLWNHMKSCHREELKEAEDHSDKKKPDIRHFAVPDTSNNNVKTWSKTSMR